MKSGSHSKGTKPVVPKTLPWFKKLLAILVYLLIRTIAGTLRARLMDPDRVLEQFADRQLIFCIWHNRLALALPAYHRFFDHANKPRKMAALVSASRDGAIVAFLLQLFGAEPVRGSSSRRGAQAILELTTWAEKGLDLAITPDGPRGPCYQVQDGAIALGQLTGLPLLPVSFHLNWKLQLRSWDRFQIPLPFARWTIYVGRPVEIPRVLSDEERNLLRTKVETEMRGLTQDGAIAQGIHPG